MHDYFSEYVETTLCVSPYFHIYEQLIKVIATNEWGIEWSLQSHGFKPLQQNVKERRGIV